MESSSSVDEGRHLLLILASINLDSPAINRYAAAKGEDYDKAVLVWLDAQRITSCNNIQHQHTHEIISPAYPIIVIERLISPHALSKDFNALLIFLSMDDENADGNVICSAWSTCKFPSSVFHRHRHHHHHHHRCRAVVDGSSSCR